MVVYANTFPLLVWKQSQNSINPSFHSSNIERMDKLISNKLNINSVPESYVLPPEGRPEKGFVPASQAISVIDLSEENGQDRTKILKEIIKASQEFGLFQVINHGIAEDVMNDMMGVAEEFFQMPMEERASLYSDDPNQLVRISTSINYSKEEIHYWRDSLRHPCHPSEKFRHLWPSKPTKYREIVERYTMEVRKLGLRTMELIGEGLRIGSSYFEDKFSYEQFIVINHYPQCPDPSLTMGLPKHCDPNIITLLHQGDVAGLQVLKNGEWFSVEPVRNAIVINLGQQIEVISNGKLKSVEHRAVTNSSAARTSIVNFFYPSNDNVVQPAQEVVDDSNPPMFKAYKYGEFFNMFQASDPSSYDKILEHFKL